MKSALFFFFGVSLQPYISLALEYWLTRPRRLKAHNYFDACGPECTIR